MRAEVICGDARDVLASLPDASVDAIVTDPPYALTDKPNGSKGFMGAAWDTGLVAHDPAFWTEVLRVARPGAFLLAFGGTRTYHRLACAIEDAGWECRDMLNWLQGSGFPKSQSCLKPSHEPILLAKAPGPLQPLQIDACRVAAVVGDRTDRMGGSAQKWGTNPYARDTYSVNVRGSQSPAHDGGRWPPNTLLSHHPDCQPAGVRRVPSDKRGQGRPHHGRVNGYKGGWADQPAPARDADGYEQVGAGACHSDCAVRQLDEQAGPRPSGNGERKVSGGMKGGTGTWTAAHGMQRPGAVNVGVRDYGDNGGPSRFFPTFAPDPEDAVPFRYEPKASRRDRNAGCEELAASLERNYAGGPLNRPEHVCSDGAHRTGARAPRGNTHPTCKPTALMAWLCKLVTPEGGVVLDPFGGSMSTGVACVKEGFSFIGIEMSPEYVAIGRARIAHEQEQQTGPLFAGASAQEAVGAR